MSVRIHSVEPTVFLRTADRSGELEQLFRVHVESDENRRCTLRVSGPKDITESLDLDVSSGRSTAEVFLPERMPAGEVTAELRADDSLLDRGTADRRRPRRWTVHLVQLSHHDVGYTDIASNVLPQMAGYLDEAIDHAEATAGFPTDAQFRLVVEQFWSLQHFLRTASPARVGRMIELIRSGHVEVTALFGNLTTELCGHEALMRSAYPAFRFAREHGFSIRTAENNDIPGFSWGLATLLTEAGIELFCPGLPLYYGWGDHEQRSFWDQQAVFGRPGPGAFYWEAQSGKRVLFFCNNTGCGGPPRTGLSDLGDALSQMERDGYPYSVVRRPVQGALRDNSPYLRGYAETVRSWNEQWAYPHLVCSTNSLFADDFVPAVGDELPVHRGELPGQDYPLGALSTAEATGVNRRNHSRFLAAERAATVAPSARSGDASSSTLRQAMEDVLWYDEHTWGFTFPAGPTQRTSELEKSVHAHRAAAGIEDVLAKSLAAIADRIRVAEEGLYLLVFNPLPFARSGPVRLPMHEFENCGSEIIAISPHDDSKGEGYLKGVTLNTRGNLHPPVEITRGAFSLVDVADGSQVAYQLADLADSMDPAYYAPGRYGLGAGGPRIARFELPEGLRRDMLFRAESVPALGYKLYRLAPQSPPSSHSAPGSRSRVEGGEDFIENEFYRIQFNRYDGRVTGVRDKVDGRELLDSKSPHGFAELVVRHPESREESLCEGFARPKLHKGPLSVSMERSFSVRGHPVVRQRVTLFAGERRVDVSMRIVKDPTPLLDVHCAFPFKATKPEFTYEGVTSSVRYMRDYLPGAFGDFVTAQNWVEVSGREGRVVFASRDAPVVSLGALWPGRVSPAHCCVVPAEQAREPQRPESLENGWIYFAMFSNNFGTNFSPYQSGDYEFSWSFTTAASALSGDGSRRPSYADAVRFGQEIAVPMETLFTGGRLDGQLPSTRSYLEIHDDDCVLLACKQADAGDGLVIRVWNSANQAKRAKIRFPERVVALVERLSLVEEPASENTPPVPTASSDTVELPVAGGEVATARVVLEEAI